MRQYHVRRGTYALALQPRGRFWHFLETDFIFAETAVVLRPDDWRAGRTADWARWTGLQPLDQVKIEEGATYNDWTFSRPGLDRYLIVPGTCVQEVSQTPTPWPSEMPGWFLRPPG